MAVRMVALVRSKNGEFVARKGIPADVREPYARLYGVKWEEQLKLPAGTSKHEAKKRLGEWSAEFETRIAALRATANGEGQPLTRLNAIALAGRWYTWFIRQHEDNQEMQGGKWPMEKYLDIAAALFALAAAVVLVFVCVGQAPSIGGLLGSSTR